MIDYYALLAVGIVLFIGLLPLMRRSTWQGGFLITYVDMSKEEEEVWQKHHEK